jgi:hypothetical protein
MRPRATISAGEMGVSWSAALVVGVTTLAARLRGGGWRGKERERKVERRGEGREGQETALSFLSLISLSLFSLTAGS